MSYFWRKSGGGQSRYQATRQNHSLHSLIPLAELCSRVGRGLPPKRITVPAEGEWLKRMANTTFRACR